MKASSLQAGTVPVDNPRHPTVGAVLVDTSHPTEFRTVRKGYDPVEVDNYRVDVEGRLAELEDRNETLDRQLRATSEEAADLLLRLDAEADRSVAAEQQLAEALQREESVRLMLHEASRTRDRIHAEAEATLEQARSEASRESHSIVKQAMDKASNIVTEAKKERSRLLASGREELAALERDAASRIADLEVHRTELSDQVEEISDVYRDLTGTIQSYLDTSREALHQAKTARLEATAVPPPRPKQRTG